MHLVYRIYFLQNARVEHQNPERGSFFESFALVPMTEQRYTSIEKAEFHLKEYLSQMGERLEDANEYTILPVYVAD